MSCRVSYFDGTYALIDNTPVSSPVITGEENGIRRATNTETDAELRSGVLGTRFSALHKQLNPRTRDVFYDVFILKGKSSFRSRSDPLKQIKLTFPTIGIIKTALSKLEDCTYTD